MTPGTLRSPYFGAYGLWHMGEGFQTILMMWYMTFHAKLSASEIGLYQSLQLLPFLAFTAMGGGLTDRIGAKLTFTASTGLFALTLGSYGLAEPMTGFHPWLFSGYCLLSGLLSALSNPAIDTFIPEATPAGAEANALMAATVHNIGKLSGNAATLLLPVLAATGGFVANGLLMAASVFLLRRHPKPALAEVAPDRAHALRRVWGFFHGNPEAFDIFLGSVMLGLFVIPGFYIFHPMVMRERFAGQADLFGLTGLVGWIGAILAAWLVSRVSARIHHPGRLALSVWAGAAVVFASLAVVKSFPILLALFFFLGCNSVGKALLYGPFLRRVPVADRGLLIGIDQTAFWGLATLGTMGLGGLVDLIGFQAALAVNSGAILLSVLVLALRGQLWYMQGG